MSRKIADRTNPDGEIADHGRIHYTSTVSARDTAADPRGTDGDPLRPLHARGSPVISFLSAGVILGLSAGFSPGPLLTLVISQALRYGVREGVKVAVSPLMTDLPVLLLSLFVLKRIEGFRTVLGAISLLGGFFVLKLAYESVRAKQPDFTPQETEPQSLVKGAVVNALNPNPYVFWLTVGGPTFLKAWDVSPLTAVLFAASFSGCLVGAKVCLAILA